MCVALINLTTLHNTCSYILINNENALYTFKEIPYVQFTQGTPFQNPRLLSNFTVFRRMLQYPR